MGRPRVREEGPVSSQPEAHSSGLGTAHFSLDLIKSLLNNTLMDRFLALAEPNRRRILEIIAQRGEVAATEISDQFRISAPAVSQHLKVLREAELVQMKKQARQRIYSINPKGMDETWEWLNEMRQFWNGRLDVLEKLLAEESESHGNKTKRR